MENFPSHLILFDGVCNLCNGAVNFVLDKDTKKCFHFASLQSESGQAFLRTQGLPTEEFNTFFYLKNGEVYSRSRAALEVARSLGGGWSLAYGFVIVPEPLRDWVYKLISKYRYLLFGKRESCRMPTPDLAQRFLA